jgi:hypothetical protein
MEVKTSLDFSRVFRERIAEHENPQGILENRAPTDASILFAKCLCHFFSYDTPRVPTRYQLNYSNTMFPTIAIQFEPDTHQVSQEKN